MSPLATERQYAYRLGINCTYQHHCDYSEQHACYEVGVAIDVEGTDQPEGRKVVLSADPVSRVMVYDLEDEYVDFDGQLDYVESIFVVHAQDLTYRKEIC